MASDDSVIPAYLGWNNAERDKESVRLYATDAGDSPRWDASPGGRVAETAVRERWGQAEGDRFLIVRVGNRFTTDERMADVATAVTDALADG